MAERAGAAAFLGGADGMRRTVEPIKTRAEP
jgi:hypothetical protein